LHSLHSSGERAGTEVAVALKFLEEMNDNWKEEEEDVQTSRFSVLMRWVYYKSGYLLEHLFTENNK
jgi:hypothetical protein